MIKCKVIVVYVYRRLTMKQLFWVPAIFIYFFLDITHGPAKAEAFYQRTKRWVTGG